MGYTLLEISAAAHQGTRELVKKAAEMLSVLPPVTVYEPEYVPKAAGDRRLRAAGHPPGGRRHLDRGGPLAAAG